MHEIATYPARAPIGTDSQGRPVTATRELLQWLAQVYERAGGPVAPTNTELQARAEELAGGETASTHAVLAEVAKAVEALALDAFSPAPDAQIAARMADAEAWGAFV